MKEFNSLLAYYSLGNHIDEMTKTWLCQTQRYTNRPQSGDLLYQGVMAQLQQRNHHHSFINSFSLAYSTLTEVISERYNGPHQFLRKTKAPENTILVSVDVTSLCTNKQWNSDFSNLQGKWKLVRKIGSSKN